MNRLKQAKAIVNGSSAEPLTVEHMREALSMIAALKAANAEQRAIIKALSQANADRRMALEAMEKAHDFFMWRLGPNDGMSLN